MAPEFYRHFRTINYMKWTNTACFMVVLPFTVIFYSSQDLKMSILMATLGLLLGAGNHLFIRNFQMSRASLALMQSYEKAKNDLLFDELTGLYSRRAGMERLREELARYQRNGKGFSLAMLDVDHFKRINDSHGHLAGDYVLQEIAKTLKTELRQSDVVTRFGGEEFLVIMPETDHRQAVYPLERLRRKLFGREISYGDSVMRVSVSIGVTSVASGKEDISEIIQRVDEALYDAKRSGRNRMVFDKQLPSLTFISAN